MGEMEWLRHLAIGGISVAKPLPSLNGKDVEAVPDGNGGSFLLRVCCFIPFLSFESGIAQFVAFCQAVHTACVSAKLIK